MEIGFGEGVWSGEEGGEGMGKIKEILDEEVGEEVIEVMYIKRKQHRRTDILRRTNLRRCFNSGIQHAKGNAVSERVALNNQSY